MINLGRILNGRGGGGRSISRTLIPSNVAQCRSINHESLLSRRPMDNKTSGDWLTRHLQEDDNDGFGKVWKALNENTHKPGQLILVRHGESIWNLQRRFTGWVDVDLSERGTREIEHCARLLRERGYTVDVTYTSVLKRAIRSSWIILKELGQIYRPAIKSWRLNERMYGALEGLSKPELVVAFDEPTVQAWRSGLVERPPPMTESHMYWHRSDVKYKGLDPNLIPVTESLQDTIDRTLPLWESHIVPDLKKGRNVMIVAHCNSLRGIVKHIDGLGTREIQKVGIPNAIPLVYKFDHDMKPIVQENSISPLSGVFLEKKEVLIQALLKEEQHAASVGGLDKIEKPSFFNASSVEINSKDGICDKASSSQAEQQRKIMHLFSEHNLNNNQAIATHGRLALLGVKCGPDEHYMEQVQRYGRGNYTSEGGNTRVTYNDQYDQDNNVDKKELVKLHRETNKTNDLKQSNSSSDSVVTEKTISPHDHRTGFTASELQGPLLIIIRHGKTEHNKLGLFTGWEDAPLANEGRDEAYRAGRLLLRHKIKVDYVYTSWLSRAIETAWAVVNELDILWVPIVKTWRLNERMYGSLTGFSKRMIKQQYGEKQFLLWRRGFDIRPPPVSSFSPFYPGNDDRYVNYVADIKISFFESLIRSLAHGKFELHRDFPKTESLKDCMERTLPYFKEEILPRLRRENKNVLIASSENAIRGLLMEICDIPKDEINKVEIPTGLPLIFDWKAKRLRLLDDEVIIDGKISTPLERYDFGSSPDLLFKPDPNNPNVVLREIRNGDGNDSVTEERNNNVYIYDPIIWTPYNGK